MARCSEASCVLSSKNRSRRSTLGRVPNLPHVRFCVFVKFLLQCVLTKLLRTLAEAPAANCISCGILT
eukprot:4183664-Amphidinium_carterae.1